VNLGVAERVGLVAVYVFRADPLGRNALSVFSGERGAIRVMAFLLFTLESVGSIFLAVNPVQVFDGVPVAGWGAIRAPVRIKVRASEIVNLESVKASGHGFSPCSSTSSGGAIGKPVSNEGPPRGVPFVAGMKGDGVGGGAGGE
jgi:hypothetical protein